VDKILDWLPARNLPLIARYGLTTAIMAALCAAQAVYAAYTGLPGLFSVVFGIMFCAVAFPGGCGYYATALAAASSYFTLRYYVPAVSPFATVAFVVFSLGLAFIGEALRLSLERAVAAERENALLLREMSHRIRNNLTVTAAMLALESRASANPAVTAALEKAAARIGVLADAHRHMELAGGAVDLGDYMRRACEQIEQMIGARRTIHCDTEPIKVASEKAVALGLVANELITNALKYAFRDGEPGSISVSVARTPQNAILLVVADDGAGYSDHASPGFGTHLIDMMVKQHDGSVARQNTARGHKVSVVMPA
jgi:two-component sensor histidine kinase